MEGLILKLMSKATRLVHTHILPSVLKSLIKLITLLIVIKPRLSYLSLSFISIKIFLMLIMYMIKKLQGSMEA